MTAYESELEQEQKYFDVAWDERERARRALHEAPQSAGGNNSTAGVVGRHAERMIAQMGSADEAVAYGRFDCDDGQTLYVGKHAISTQDRDVLVINWKLDAAKPYYKASVGDPCGVALKRQFETHKNDIKSFEDTLFADLAERVESLTQNQLRGIDDSVLRDLEVGRDGEMRDIVQTIHASQYAVIESPLDRLLIVQGGPGTGKTVVALHRVSMLLFNHRESMTAADILVVGPSRTFTRYIQKVLPSLGDEGVTHGDLRSMGPISSDGRPEEPEVARLKGDARMATLLERGLWQRARFPERSNELLVGQGEAAARFTRSEVETQLSGLAGRTAYMIARQSMRQWLSLESPKRTRSTTAVDAASIDQALERIWPSLTPQAFLQDLLGSRPRLSAAAGDDFTARDVDRLYRAPTERLTQETWSDTDIALLDDAQVLINGRGPSYAHVVVDEAQDLSPMQLRSISRRSSEGSYTIVGDVAQSTGPWARSNWSDVAQGLKQRHPVEEATLGYGYRVPAQIFQLAAQLLPKIAPELDAPQVIRSGPADPEFVRTAPEDVPERAVAAACAYAARGLFVGLICADGYHDQLATAFQDRDVSFDDASKGQFGKPINLLTAEQSKGLEFDAIVVVEPAAIAESGATGLRKLYVALTRTTRFLTIAQSREWLEQATAVEPQPESPDVTLHRKSQTEAHPSSASSPNPTADRPASRRPSIVNSVAKDLASDIKLSLSPDAYAQLIDALAQELGIDRPRSSGTAYPQQLWADNDQS